MSNLLQQGLELSKNKNIHIVSDQELMVRCDVVKIAIVIKNLLDNAEKYAPSENPVNILYSQNKDIIKISFKDRGPGISENIIEKIMQPYVRGENLQKSGFGLGLSICKRVMRAHNGTINVINNNKKGATFTIEWNNKDVGTIENAKK